MKRLALFSIICLFYINSFAVFTFTANYGQSSGRDINFGSVYLGQSKYGLPQDNIIFTCKSDQGRRWQLQIKANGDLNSGQYTIPLRNLKYFGTYASSMEEPRNNERFFSKNAFSLKTSEQTFYRSDLSGDLALSQTAVYLQLGITVPDTQPQGIYTTSLIITMTE